MKDERFYELMSRKIASEATIQELEELLLIVNEFPELKTLLDNLTVVDEATAPEEKIEAAYRRHLAKNRLNGQFTQADENYMAPEFSHAGEGLRNKSYPLKKILLFTGIAAAVTAIIVLVIPALFSVKQVSTAVNEVATKKGNKTKITLSDGTTVWLNSDSRLVYDGFEGKKREVRLIGEAFFDVVKDSLNPFVIYAGNVKVKVLGTAFNVKAYPNDNKVEAALVRGLIELTTSEVPDRKILLHPHEKASILSQTNDVREQQAKPEKNPEQNIYTLSRLIPDKTDSTIDEIAWIDNKLVFKSEHFDELAKRMERWFDVKIIFSQDNLKELLFTGYFERHTIFEALQQLQFSCNYKFKYTSTGNTITIKPK